MTPMLDSSDCAETDSNHNEVIRVAIVMSDQRRADELASSLAKGVSFRTQAYATLPDWTSAEPLPHVVVLECAPGKLIVGLNQVQTVMKQIPLVPIIAFSDTDEADFRMAFWNAGVSDFLTPRMAADEVRSRLAALFQLSKTAHLLNAQNHALLRSMEMQRESNEQLKSEIDARTQAEINLKSFQELMFQTARLKALGEIAGTLFHEIATPLTVIKAQTELLVEKAMIEPLDAEKVRAFGERILRNVERILSISRGVRVTSRNSSGEAPQATPQSLSALLRDVKSLVDGKCHKADVKLTWPVLEETYLVMAEATKFNQVLVNLVNNAVDAIETLNGDRWITLESSTDGDAAVLTLTDCGNGIPELVRKKMFDPFFTTKEAGKGTGLGLGIASTLMISMGGALVLDEKHPHTRFVLRLPRPNATN